MESGSVLIELVRGALGYKSCEIPEAIEWPEVQELARRHRVVSLLRAVLPESAPLEVSSWAGTAALQSAQRGIQTRLMLARLKERFEAAGVRALLFKGIALQQWAYGNLIRIPGDVDLLIEPHADERAAVELANLGFKRDLSRVNSASSKRLTGLWRDDLGNAIDLHSTVIESYVYPFPNFSELWEQRIEIASLAFPFFGPVHHMLLLFLHGSKHQWCRLSWIVDVAVASRKLEESDVVRLYDLSKKMQTTRAVAVGYLLCDEIIGLPTKWHDFLSLPHTSPKAKSIATAYRQRLFVPLPNTPQSKLWNVLLHLRTFEGVGHKARYLVERLSHALRRQ